MLQLSLRLLQIRLGLRAISWVASGIVLPLTALADGSASYQSYSDNVPRTITSYGGTDYTVQSTTNYFIPNKTQAEWDAFYAKANAGQLAGLTISAAGGAGGSQTWNTPGTYTWQVPAGVSSIFVDVRGAGGGGGTNDNEDTAAGGASGDKVTATLSVTAGHTLTLYVAQGGHSSVGEGGGAGGSGYTAGGGGSDGDDWGAGEWAYGGAGGGGSSALKDGTTLLAEAKGGNGGTSSDYWSDYWGSDISGGAGGLGGGSDSGGVTSGYGGPGGAQFDYPGASNGSSGQVTIAWGAVAPFTPDPPTINGATSSSLVVSWNPAPGATSYTVARSTAVNMSGAVSLGTKASGFTDTGLSGTTTYYYTITAVNATGSSSASAARGGTTLVAPPSAPSAPTVNGATGTSLVVSWSAVTGATSYTVARSTASDMSGAVSLGTRSSGFTNTGLSLNTTYYYTVTAVNASGSSPASPAGSGTTLNTLSTPTAPYISNVTTSSLVVSWSVVTGATSYTVSRSTAANMSGAVSLGTKTSGFTDSGLATNTTYYYTVTAVNGGGSSSASPPGSGSTLPSNVYVYANYGGQNCSTVCTTMAGGSCISIGDDSGGTNGRYHDYYDCGGTCGDAVSTGGTCSTVLNAGTEGSFANCRCNGP